MSKRARLEAEAPWSLLRDLLPELRPLIFCWLRTWSDRAHVALVCRQFAGELRALLEVPRSWRMIMGSRFIWTAKRFKLDRIAALRVVPRRYTGHDYTPGVMVGWDELHWHCADGKGHMWLVIRIYQNKGRDETIMAARTGCNVHRDWHIGEEQRAFFPHGACYYNPREDRSLHEALDLFRRA